MLTNSPVVIAKFGGTSVGTTQAIRLASNIVTQNKNIKVIVVSATSGTTNELIKLINCFEHLDIFHDHNEIDSIIQRLIDKHVQIAFDLDLPFLAKEIQDLFLEAKVVSKTLSKNIHQHTSDSLKQKDRVLSIGERVSALIFSKHLQMHDDTFQYLSARTVIKTDSQYGHARPLYNESYELIKKELIPSLSQGRKFVTEGFIGSNNLGFTTTLGRGGSDHSASIFGAALQAEEVQIWTDVEGIFTCDPKITPKAKVIPKLSFNEASELCTFGAKVLHPATINPCREKNIPIKILSTFNPDAHGTTITINHPEAKSDSHYRGIVIRKKQKLIHFELTQKKENTLLLSTLFSILAKYSISVDLINTSESNLTLMIDESLSPIHIRENALTELSSLGSLRIEEDFDLVGIIGLNLNLTHIFSYFEECKPRLVNFGSSPYSILFTIKNNESEALVRKLHLKLIENNL